MKRFRLHLFLCIVAVYWTASYCGMGVAKAAMLVPGTSYPIGVEDVRIGDWSYDASFYYSTYTYGDPVLSGSWTATGSGGSVDAFCAQLLGLLNDPFVVYVTNVNGQYVGGTTLFVPYDDPSIVSGYVRYAQVVKGGSEWTVNYPYTPLEIGGSSDWSNLWAVVDQHPIPIPGAVWLLGSGLVGIVGIRRKFQK